MMKEREMDIQEKELVNSYFNTYHMYCCDDDLINRFRQIRDKLADKNMVFKFNGEKFAVYSMDQFKRTQIIGYEFNLDQLEEFVSKEEREITLNKRIKDIIQGFFEANKEYVVELYVNSKTDSMIVRIDLGANRKIRSDEKTLYITDADYDYAVAIKFDEVEDCYVDDFEMKYMGEIVIVKLKNGVTIVLECVSTRG